MDDHVKAKTSTAYDHQALEGARKVFEELATGANPAPLAFAQAIGRASNTIFCGCMMGPNDPDPKCDICKGSGDPAMSQGHTPGPWNVGRHRVDGHYGAQVLFSTTPLHPADAALIAAAPDLLAVLQAFPIRQSESDADYLALCFEWWVRKANKAIAKAEGRA